MNLSIRIVGAWIVLVLSSFGLAQTTAPATAPSGPVAVDQSTPRGAIKVYFLANANSDGDAIRLVLLGESAAQDTLIAAIADQRNADRSLTDAIKARFPDEHRVDSRQAKLDDLESINQNVDQSDEKVDGNTATVLSGGANTRPLTLKRVDGKWRIPLAVLKGELEPAQLTQAAHQIEIQVQAMRAGAQDVAAGKYATQKEAIETINQQMFTAALADHTATQPAPPPAPQAK